jgi:serine/threonine-protein kinase
MTDDEPDDGFPSIDDLIDRTLGQYRIGPVIGRGNMGRVYRGEHAGLGRTCAIKVMNPGLVDRQPQILERFWAEARALAGLMHPHVVTVHNLGSDRGYHYIEMEYVPGGVSLKETLVRGGTLAPVRATNLVRQVAQALGAAHQAGLVHRDVKPANVLLTADGKAKLADFGLVRDMNDGLASGPIAGTPTFMAPELFTGAPASPQSDLYAVGVMYYYLLSARLPFASDRLPLLIRLHQRAPVPDVRHFAPTVPDDIASILDRCLAKDPADRYSSSQELMEELQAVIFHLRDVESLIRECLEGLDGVVEGAQDRWRILLKVPGSRLQEVRLELTEDRTKRRLLSVYSVCCPADPGHYEFALKLNAELTYGGLSIHDVDGKPMFVMTRAYPGGDVSPEEIRAAVQEIARQSDWVEQQLTRADVF